MPAKTYKVTKQFTDQKGRSWRVGENFTGDEQAIQQAKQAGQIEESSTNQSNQSGQAQNEAE